MGIIRESFVILKGWTDAINELPDECQLEAFKALISYAQTSEIPNGISAVSKAMLVSFSYNMGKTIAKYNASVENGKLGGRPKNNNPTEPSETQNNPAEPAITEAEPRQNLYVNVNDNSKLVSQSSNNKLTSLFITQGAGACESDEDDGLNELGETNAETTERSLSILLKNLRESKIECCKWEDYDFSTVPEELSKLMTGIAEDEYCVISGKKIESWRVLTLIGELLKDKTKFMQVWVECKKSTLNNAKNKYKYLVSALFNNANGT